MARSDAQTGFVDRIQWPSSVTLAYLPASKSVASVVRIVSYKSTTSRLSDTLTAYYQRLCVVIVSGPNFSYGFHRRCIRRCGTNCIRRCLTRCVYLRVDHRQGFLWSQERHCILRQGPELELRPEWQPRAVHAGVEPHWHDQVRDFLLLAPSIRRRHRQAGGVHDSAEAHPLPGIRRERQRCVPHQQLIPRVLRWSLLDHVEVAHVRVPGLRPGVEGDRGVQENLPGLLRARVGLRQREAGADLRVLGCQAQLSYSPKFSIVGSVRQLGFR